MFGLAEAKALIVLHRAKKGKAPDFSEARPYQHGVHPPVPSICTLCHANRRCQRMATTLWRFLVICPSQFSVSRNDGPQDFLGVANVHQAGPDVSRDMARDRVRRDLSQGIKFNFV